jgi:CHAT domain-containing protein
MTDLTDLQIQFRRAKKTSSDGRQSTHEVLATVNGSGSWGGDSTIDYTQLAEAERVPREYGKQLGDILFNPRIMNALRTARGLVDRPVRIRLWLEMGPNGEREDQHGLRWERAFVVLNGKDWPLAIAPRLPFSRYVPAESIDSDAPDDSVFRLLVVFASPDNLPSEQKPIEVEADLSTLLDGIGPLTQGRRFRLVVMPGRTGISDALQKRLTASETQVVEGPSTIESIARGLHDCHGLHLVAHGNMNPETQRGSLVLENKDGHRALAFDDDLNSWIYPNLRAVVLQSCQSAAPTPKIGPPFVGIGPRLVQLGVPAVVAMQDYVAMDDARVFAAAFYRSLVRDGIVDVAVNEGRQAIFQKSNNDNFSIPALFMRLKGGLLWRPDPLRSAVVAGLAEVETQAEHSLPTRAVQSLGNSLDYDAEAGPAGPLFDTPMKLLELSLQDKALVLFVGPRGMTKGSQLQWVYRRAARRFLDDEDGTAPAPVSLALPDILNSRRVLDAIDKNVSALAKTPPDGATSSGRPLLLIIDGEADFVEDPFRDALRKLVEFRTNSAHRIVMTLEEGSRAAWDSDLVPTAVLVARPMDFARVCQHLKQLGNPEAIRVHAVIEKRRCRDLAGMPWLLERMLFLSERKATIDSRAELLRQIASECLNSISMGGVPRSCVERALEQIAWRMQWGRRSILGGGPLYEILAAVRDNREFRLGDLKDSLVRSGILATAGEDGIRFRYESLQAYYAARYLAAAPDQQDLLEDITASLGRMPRARWWENTLVTMAGLLGQSSEGLLQTIVAGSPLVEGDQVYLASRCFLDTRKIGGDSETWGREEAARAPPVIDQIVDALIWRSHPGNLRPYTDRKRAAIVLAELRHPNAIPHLVSLASEEIATGWGTEKRYELSSIRLIAVNGLMLMQDAAIEYVLKERPRFATVLTAWRNAYEHGDPSELIAELHKNDGATSPIAAFALGYLDGTRAREEPSDKTLDARQKLLDVFAKDDTDRDLGWAVADTFTLIDPMWVSTNVIEPRLQTFSDPRVPYLIGWLGMAAEGSKEREYLEQCLAQGIPAVQARALRALGLLRADSKRTLCESVVAGDWAKVRQGMSLPPEIVEDDRNRLQNAAMESLREIGTAESIEALRTSRQRAVGMTITLRQLSFDVAEDIYWRESFDPRKR